MTNDIKHHLTDALLMAYSAGSLPEGFNLVVATHISMCDECRARMHEFDTVGGAVMDAEAPIGLSDGSFAATLALIAKNPTDADMPKPAKKVSSLPAPLHDYVGTDLSDVKWRKVGGGVRQAILKAKTTTTNPSPRWGKIVSVLRRRTHHCALTAGFRGSSNRFYASKRPLTPRNEKGATREI